MCGLAGFIGSRMGDGGKLMAVATGMALTIQHRGPDDAGAWADAEAGVVLERVFGPGHRDRSPGSEPPHGLGHLQIEDVRGVEGLGPR